jgi:hypothetical protein
MREQAEDVRRPVDERDEHDSDRNARADDALAKFDEM